MANTLDPRPKMLQTKPNWWSGVLTGARRNRRSGACEAKRCDENWVIKMAKSSSV